MDFMDSKYMSKNIGENISKNLSDKYSQNAAEATGDLMRNKMAVKITKVPRTSPHNSSETVAGEAENIGFDR